VCVCVHNDTQETCRCGNTRGTIYHSQYITLQNCNSVYGG